MSFFALERIRSRAPISIVQQIILHYGKEWWSKLFREPSASIGSATFAAPEESPDELLARVDRAMHRAKQTGRGRSVHDFIAEIIVVHTDDPS